MICTAANGIWLAGCLREAARFRRAARDVRREQERLLRELLRTNQDTEFGRRHGFDRIASVRDYQARVPVRSYDDYETDISRIAAGHHGVLTSERVRLLEPTSGSASATKLIPYTRSLQRQFQRGINAWIADLFVRNPGLMRGQAYWSVSPVMRPQTRTVGGLPIGFDDDAAYVGGWRRVLVDAVMAAPASLRRTHDIEAFQYRTLLSLVRSDSLRLISIWNPAFLSVILDRMPARAESFLRDLRGAPHRARVVRAALDAPTVSERHARLWPRLRLISCWADANAAGPAAQLAQWFPQARVQPKGLIATEGFVSLPLIGHEGAALSIRSHFFEFAPIDSTGGADERSPLMAHELESGRRYTVIMSTGGGLYRYRLNDVVEVIGHMEECPLLRFAGKHEYVSDWFGEKLHEVHVAAVLREAATQGVPAFAILACDRELSPAAYVAYVESTADDATLSAMAETIEGGLRRNFHYDYARLLGQLGPVRIFRAEEAARSYLTHAVAAGQRAGDVKPLALDRRDGWSRRFRGSFIQMPSRNTLSGSAPFRPCR
jgi:GH3 auxin-responsive promoter